MISTSTFRKSIFGLAISLGVLCSGEGNAQVVYTDLNPDVTKGELETYDVDFNNDGTREFEIIQHTVHQSNAKYITAYANEQPTMILGYEFRNEVKKFAVDEFIGNTNIFPYVRGYFGFYTDGTADPDYFIWRNNGTGYFGVKFEVNDNIHYGWVNIEVSSTDMASFIVRSFAYDSRPNVAIKAGATANTQAVSSLTASKVVSGNSENIQVSYTKATDETGIAKYRLFIVPAAQAPAFDLATAQFLPSDRFIEYNPGSNLVEETIIPSALKDSEGNNIANNHYKVFVMTVGASGYGDNISEGSESFTLGTPSSNTATIVNDRDLYFYYNSLFLKSIPSNGQVTIINSSGEKVFNAQVTKGDNKIDLSTLQNGLFVAILESENKKQIKKFIK